MRCGTARRDGGTGRCRRNLLPPRNPPRLAGGGRRGNRGVAVRSGRHQRMALALFGETQASLPVRRYREGRGTYRCPPAGAAKQTVTEAPAYAALQTVNGFPGQYPPGRRGWGRHGTDRGGGRRAGRPEEAPSGAAGSRPPFPLRPGVIRPPRCPPRPLLRALALRRQDGEGLPPPPRPVSPFPRAGAAASPQPGRPPRPLTPLLPIIRAPPPRPEVRGLKAGRSTRRADGGGETAARPAVAGWPRPVRRFSAAAAPLATAARGRSHPPRGGVGTGSARRSVSGGDFPPRPAQWEAPGIPRHPLFTNQPQRAELQLQPQPLEPRVLACARGGGRAAAPAPVPVPLRRGAAGRRPRCRAARASASCCWSARWPWGRRAPRRWTRWWPSWARCCS